ncbi:tetratricopeptide repeat protein [Maribacter sp. 2307ULW6-5]|uniref:tetratricopeptide repeat protein n=1 Tax=Maribacter sp. 2307ULW6-5 TaxID=3386275 RepID=UPI0039BCE17F
MKTVCRLIAVLFAVLAGHAQEEDPKMREKALEASTNLTWEGNKNISEDNFITGEVAYRKAIAKSPENAAAPFNLGTAYYQRESYSEAFGRFKQAGEVAASKEGKHKAYHNMGNVFMQRKDYAKAVEAYKEALRNNPKDEETRYNLALAKELLEKDQQNQDQNEDNKENQDQDDQKEENQDQKDQGDEGDQGENDQKDKGNEGDQKDQQEDENKEGDGNQQKEQNKKPEEGEGQNQQQPRPNQLSKEQVENLLRAMQNAEKKVKEKIDAKKAKGTRVKTEKDW